MEILNCTPHAINIIVNGESKTYEPSGIIPRVTTSYSEVEMYEGLPFVKSYKGEVENLPERKRDVLLLVSGMVFEAVSNFRTDIIAPDTGSTAIRNDKGHIVAVTRFLRK